MKICRDCSSACDNALQQCPRCGSTNLALVAEKHCVYCKTRVAIGTIICPQCHRILPPESEDIQTQNYSQAGSFGGDTSVASASVGLANVNAGEGNQNAVDNAGNIQYVKPITHISENQNTESVKAVPFEQNITATPAQNQAKTENLSGISDFDKSNPLFAIYDNTPDVLPIKKAEGVSAVTYSENIESDESLQADVSDVVEAKGYNNIGVLQTKQYQSQRVSREEEKPQSKLPRMLIFTLGCIYTVIGLMANYMVHDYGNVIGWEMACSVIIKLRDVFPSVYPYILYGSSFLSKFESMGSYMPFFIDHAMMFSLFAGITMMISAVPKWVVVVLHAVVVACHIGGAYMLGYLFGFGCIGVGAYFFIAGSIAVLVLHLIFVNKVYKFK